MKGTGTKITLRNLSRQFAGVSAQHERVEGKEMKETGE